MPTQMGLIASTYCGLFLRFVPDLYGTTTSNIFAHCFSFFNETASIDVIRCSLRRSCVLSFLARKRMFVSSHIPCLLYVRCHKSYSSGRCNFFRYSTPLWPDRLSDPEKHTLISFQFCTRVYATYNDSHCSGASCLEVRSCKNRMTLSIVCPCTL